MADHLAAVREEVERLLDVVNQELPLRLDELSRERPLAPSVVYALTQAALWSNVLKHALEEMQKETPSTELEEASAGGGSESDGPGGRDQFTIPRDGQEAEAPEFPAELDSVPLNVDR